MKVQAAKRVLATAGGAYLRVEGGGIQLHAPGKVELKAGVHNWAGPQSAPLQLGLPEGDFEGCQLRMQSAAASGAAAVEL